MLSIVQASKLSSRLRRAVACLAVTLSFAAHSAASQATDDGARIAVDRSDRSRVPQEFLHPWGDLAGNLWQNTGPRTRSVYAGDLNASYPQILGKVDPKLEMIVQGDFPKLRYFSLTAYDHKNRPIAILRDDRIAPDPGHVNPFVAGADWNAPRRQFTITVRFTAPPKGLAAGGYYGAQTADGNTIYLGTAADGTPNPSFRIAYRRYLPTVGLGMDGGVGEPRIVLRRVSDGAFVKTPAVTVYQVMDMNYLMASAPDQSFARLAGGASVGAAPAEARKDSLTPPSKALIWNRSSQNPLLGENPEQVYIRASVKPSSDEFLVMRWKAPRTPNTHRNEGIKGGEQLRYWSLAFTIQELFTTIKTVSDADVTADVDGYVNLVVGFGAPRPPEATAENGYTFVEILDQPVRRITYRNLLPASDFPYSANGVPSGEPVGDRMGGYLPAGRFMTSAEFSREWRMRRAR